jgi:hypothetical protein
MLLEGNMQTKKWYQSWTIWANVLALVVFVANGVGFGEFRPEPWVSDVGTIIVLIINIVLRYFGSGARLEK